MRFAVLSSSLLSGGVRSLLDLLLLDLGGGDLNFVSEREDVLDIEGEGVLDLLRLRAALPSGDGDLEDLLYALERLSRERSRDGMVIRVSGTCGGGWRQYQGDGKANPLASIRSCDPANG